MSHPFEGWSAINEGWDSGGGIDLADIGANLKTVARNFAGPVALVLIALWSLKILISLLVGGLMVIGGIAEVGALYTVAQVVSFVGIALLLVIGIVQWSLFRPMQLQAFEGREFIGGVGDAARLSREVVVKTAITALVWGLSLFVGGLGCGIGMLIPFFFFSQAPYLAATTELSPWECMRRSYELNKAYFMPVLGAVVASLAIMTVVQGCGRVIVAGLGGALNTVNLGLGALVSGLGGDLLGLFGGAVILVITATVYTTIQSVERQIPFHE